MNQSRGEISAETVASTNEPLTSLATLLSNHHHHSSSSSSSSSSISSGSSSNSISSRLHNPYQSAALANNYHTTANENNNQPSSIVDYFTKSIHQQLNPSSSSLPTLLARSLVASFGGGGVEGEDGDQLLSRQQQQQQQILSAQNQVTTTTTATDTDLQQQNYYEQQSFNEWWTDYWSRQPFPSGYTQSSITLLACLITTIIFLIVVGNLLVVVAIFTEKSLKPTQNWFIASLAVSDMLLGLVVMPFSLARELMGFWIFGPLWCDIHEAIDVLLTTASINTLCLISLDRYWSITQAVNYLKKRTPKRGAFMIAFVWIFSAAVSLPPLFGWKKQSPTIIANITTPSNSNKHKHNSAKHLKLTPTTTTTTTTTVDPLTLGFQLKRRHVQQSGANKHQKSLEGRRQELATPLLNGGIIINEAMHSPAGRLILTRAPKPPSSQHENRRREAPTSGFQSYNENLADESFEMDNNNNNNNNNNNMQYQDQEQFSASSAAGSANSIPTITMQPPLQLSSTSTQATLSDQVTEYPSCQLSDDIGYVLYSALGSFYIPCAVMVFTYIKIFLAARSRARRAISKQSRGAATSANKRTANRRTPNPSAPVGGANRLLAAETSGASNPITSCNSVAISSTGLTQLNNQQQQQQPNKEDDTQKHNHQQQQPMMKGKIVIVERKKSIAAAPIGLQQHQQQQMLKQNVDQQKQLEPSQKNQMNSATYTCSDLITSHSSTALEQQRQQQQQQTQMRPETEVVELLPAADSIMSDVSGSCTLTTSGAKQASLSALNGDSLSHDSSMITVMNASMSEVPVTRFNFKQQRSSGADLLPETTRQPTVVGDEEESRKAAALLRALSQVGAENEDQLLRQVWSADNGEANDSSRNNKRDSVQDIVSDYLNTTSAINNNNSLSDCNNNNSDGLVFGGGPEVLEREHGDGGGGGANTTNETCFMTIEEDSDMFDTQTGRTIMMIAGNASQKQANSLGKAQGGIMMTMLPPGSGGNHHHQQQQQQNLAQQNSVICNNVVCMQRPQHQPVTATRSASSYCGSSMTINDDDIDDCVDDELLTDDCNGYSVSCGLDQYCPGISACPQCQECIRQQQNDQELQDREQQQDQPAQNNNNRHLSISESSNRKKQQQQQKQPLSLHHHHHHNRRISEAHSMTGDDNLSLNEYRSNEDSSSIAEHDVLDATEVHRSDKKRPASSGSNEPPNMGRKKSSIGFRLTRLGSTAPLTVQTGGLLALATSQQQQQQHQQQQQQTGGGTRNLKALRQNFFMKLNQLTAKSAAKQQEYKSKKFSEYSPTGKSSAQSSGTSFEPSVDCATTSNVQSADYQPEITADEYEQHTSNEPRSSLTSKGAESRGHQHRDSNTSSTVNSSSATSNKQKQVSNQELKTSSQPDSGAGGVGGKDDSPSSDNEFRKSTGISNNQMIDKNNDRALLLHDPQKSGNICLDGANNSNGNNNNNNNNKRLLGNSNSLLVTSGQNGKSQMKFSGKDNHHSQQPQQQLQRTKSSQNATVNHTSGAMNPSGAANAGTNRAYLASDNERHKRKLAKARERRATLILGLIMAAFICSWMPFFTFYVLRALCTVCRDFISPRFEAFIFWMGYCNSAINPIIYTIFNRDFRKAFRKILFKCL